jgi:hypothetical protein
VPQKGNFTITKSSSNVRLYLNGFEQNISILAGDSLNATASLLRPANGELIQLYINGNLSANSSTPATNVSTYTIPGIYVVVAEFLGNDNYTYVNVTRQFNISDDVGPMIHSINATPNTTILGNNITIYANVTDNVAVDEVRVSINGTNHSMDNNTPNIFFYIFNTTNYAPGEFTYIVYANDTAGENAIPKSGNFTILKRPSQLELYLNGTQSNQTFSTTDTINLTAVLLAPTSNENIQLYVDGILSANSSSPAVRLMVSVVLNV